MPDLDTLLRERLDAPVDVVAPSLAELRDRAWHRRQRRLSAGAVAVVAAVSLGVVGISGNGLGLPGLSNDTARYATGETLPALLDQGVGPDGPWRLEVTRDDGWCLELTMPGSASGSCQQGEPARLDETLTALVPDGDAMVLLVAGAVPNGTNSVEVRSAAEQLRVPARLVAGRLYFSTRLASDLPPGSVVTVTALDADGQELARGELPFIPARAVEAAIPPPDVTPGTPEMDCQLAFQEQTGTWQSADPAQAVEDEAAREAFLQECLHGPPTTTP